jgi:protein SCO1/2
MKRSYVIRAIFLTSLILASLPGCSGKPRNLNGSPYEPPKPAPALDLQTLAGDTFDLSTLQGDIVLVYFGYTYCPDVCPTTLAEVKLIFEQLGDQAERVHLIMVTVDPERDTPQVLNAYLDRFNPRFLGLWGQGEKLERVLSSYGVFAQKEPSDDPDHYLVSHSARLFIIDQEGMLRSNYSFGTPREDILSDIEYLLEEESGS